MTVRTSQGVSLTEHIDPVQVRRGYSFRACPGRSQETRAVRLLADHCDLCNTGLEERRETRRMHHLAPRPDGEGGFAANNAAAKAALNKVILDAGWAQFAGMLADKAESAGRRVVLGNPAGTSITCHQCRRRCERPRRDIVICPRCGPMDADVNGARNIYARAGLGSGQAAAAACDAAPFRQRSSHGISSRGRSSSRTG